MTSHCATPSLRNSAASPTSPTATGRGAPSLKPSERYLLIAHRLGVSPREAELLWIVANHGPIIQGAIAGQMGSCEAQPRVLIYRLRKLRSIPIKSDPYVGYSLELADRMRVLAAASVAPSGAGVHAPDSSQETGRGVTAPAPFQPTGDLTRQSAEHIPFHTETLSSLSLGAPRDDHRSDGTCIPPNGTIPP